jgi:hypothetical protein
LEFGDPAGFRHACRVSHRCAAELQNDHRRRSRRENDGKNRFAEQQKSGGFVSSRLPSRWIVALLLAAHPPIGRHGSLDNHGPGSGAHDSAALHDRDG